MQRELEGSHQHYRTGHHRPTFTALRVAAAEHVPPDRGAKGVVVGADARPVLLVLPADHHVDLYAARGQLGVSDVRLADEHEIARLFPEAEVGAVPPLRHWPGVEIYLDASLMCDGEIWFQAGTHEDAIAMDFTAWRRWANPRIGDFARPMPGPAGDRNP
jgi:Ala-tRNA(Pro) deacylase